MDRFDRSSKDEWRRHLGQTGMTREDGNKAAEQLRRLPAYRQATALFAGPGAELLQIRSNALIDGKELLMPAPGLKEGFYLLRPYTVSFADVVHAVTYKGLAQFGKLLNRQALGGLGLDLLLTGAVAVDGCGGRLGDGHGFFDLASAILHDAGAVASRALTLAAVAEQQIMAGQLPRDAWDAPVDGLLTPTGFQKIGDGPLCRPTVHWEAIPFKRVRKITPLWNLYQELHPLPGRE